MAEATVARDNGVVTALRSHPDAVLGFVGALAVTVGTYGLADVPRNDSTLGDLGLPFVPGSKTFTADAASPVDTWRAR